MKVQEWNVGDVAAVQAECFTTLQGLWLYGGDTSAGASLVDLACSNYLSSHCFLCCKVSATPTFACVLFYKSCSRLHLHTLTMWSSKKKVLILQWTTLISDCTVKRAVFSCLRYTSHATEPHCAHSHSLPHVPFCHLPGALFNVSLIFTHFHGWGGDKRRLGRQEKGKGRGRSELGKRERSDESWDLKLENWSFSLGSLLLSADSVEYKLINFSVLHSPWHRRHAEEKIQCWKKGIGSPEKQCHTSH